LTHSAIDDDLRLPPGSTSYYVRTRRDLINLVVQRLSTQSINELAGHHVPDHLTTDGAIDLVMTGVEATKSRTEEHTARLLLLLECRNDAEIYAALSAFPTLHAVLVDGVRVLLERLGVDQPHAHAADLLGLIDAMIMQRVIRSAHPLNERTVLHVYLSGLPRTRPATTTTHRDRQAAKPGKSVAK